MHWHLNRLSQSICFKARLSGVDMVLLSYANKPYFDKIAFALGLAEIPI